MLLSEAVLLDQLIAPFRVLNDLNLDLVMAWMSSTRVLVTLTPLMAMGMAHGLPWLLHIFAVLTATDSLDAFPTSGKALTILFQAPSFFALAALKLLDFLTTRV